MCVHACLHDDNPTLPSLQLCCPCCVATTEWRVTGQGIRWRKNRAPVNCCGDGEGVLSVTFDLL